MTKIRIRIEHKNLPKTRGNILDNQLSPEEIKDAVERFPHEIFVNSGDNMLTVSKSKSGVDGETVYCISSSLKRADLIAAIEKVMSGLKLGGSIFREQS